MLGLGTANPQTGILERILSSRPSSFGQNSPNSFPYLPFPVPPLLKRPPYTLVINSGNYRIEEVADKDGNIRGSYSNMINNHINKLPSLPPPNPMPEMRFFPFPRFPPPFTPFHPPLVRTTEKAQENETEESDENVSLPTTTETESP